MFKKLETASNPVTMRAAIEKARMDHALIHKVLAVAQRDSLSQQDAYTMLAYYAICALIDCQVQLAQLIAMTPVHVVVLDESPPCDTSLKPGPTVQ